MIGHVMVVDVYLGVHCVAEGTNTNGRKQANMNGRKQTNKTGCGHRVWFGSDDGRKK
jgi:hypothetical protein